MYKYVIEIVYSGADEGYIAAVPELAGCSAFGESEEDALEELITGIELWLHAAGTEGREIPQPAGKELLRAIVSGKVAVHHARTPAAVV